MARSGNAPSGCTKKLPICRCQRSFTSRWAIPARARSPALTTTRPNCHRKEPSSAMLDQLRQQIQTYLDELLGEVDKLRRALGALGSRDGAAPPSPSATPSAAPERARQAPTGRDRDRAGPRERQHHAVKAGQDRRGDQGRSPRAPVSWPSWARQEPENAVMMGKGRMGQGIWSMALVETQQLRDARATAARWRAAGDARAVARRWD